jgi:carbamoyl-phosphate synthase large subunit
MKSHLTVLVSSAGRRVALMDCFRRDAESLGLDLRLIASDMKPDLSAACTVSDAAFAAPPCNQPEFASFIYDLCRNERVDLIVPTIDTELPVFASISGTLEADGTRVILSSKEVVALARDKWRTATELRQFGIATPKTVKASEFDPNDDRWVWPLIVKPTSGSSSVGLQIVNRENFKPELLGSDVIIQERLVGDEYTVNIFFDQRGTLRCVTPHLRIETRGGEVSKGETAHQPALEEMGRCVGRALPGARGPLCFQAIVNSGGVPSLFEINARFGGGFPLAHKAGAHFTRWLLEEAEGRPSSAGNNWRSGVRMLRYDAAVFR